MRPMRFRRPSCQRSFFRPRSLLPFLSADFVLRSPPHRTVLLSGESTSTSLLLLEKKSSPNVNDSRSSEGSKETSSRLILRPNGETATEDGEDGATTVPLKVTGEM